MEYIVWKKPDGDVAVTTVFVNKSDLKKYADLLIERGDIPKDYVFIGTNLPIPQLADKIEDLEIDLTKKEIKVKQKVLDKKAAK